MTKLIAITQGAGELIGRDAQEIISYITRVSAPLNQNNFDTAPKLLKYCIDHNHWSPFEHSYLTIEIQTSRAIAAQILRHRSFTFQEFSQRYAESASYEECGARRQDTKNRQNSLDDLPEAIKAEFRDSQQMVWELAYSLYEQALEDGIAKECARFLLPLNTSTKLYMSGSVRSWIHYIQLRAHKDTQLEHREIAEGCKTILCNQLPDIGKALGWEHGSPAKEL